MLSKASLPLSAYQIDYNLPADFNNNGGSPMNMSMSNVMTPPQPITNGPVGSTHTFWVYNFYTDTDYQITATNVAIGTNCIIFSADTNDIGTTEGTTIATEFDTNIWGLVNTNFGSPSDVDSNSKVIILYFDIIDEYTHGGGSYVGGYFWSKDLFIQSNSNEMEIFYMDTNPSSPLSDEGFGTVAHEFQHMVNYNQNVFVEGGAGASSNDTWINEGLSEAANELYMDAATGTDTSLTGRISYWNSSSDCNRDGHPLCVWEYGNTLPNYAMSYLFFQYMRIHSSGGSTIYKSIIDHADEDYRCVEAIAQSEMGRTDFEELLLYWRLANYKEEATGDFGYGSEGSNYDIDVYMYSGSSASLKSGGAVYKNSSGGTFTPSGGAGSDIRFAGFD